ncbi:MAG: PIN domain-containing protein [Methanobacterium sp. ERen5]|nr:MAG: PIN domain-containing protein [Methanobacterium sp. ERen5]
MKDKFPEYYNKPNFEILWKECVFVIDTNIFINLYSFSEEDYDEFTSVLEEISNRLWMPYQIGWEYQKNRHIGLKNTQDKFNKFNGLINQINPKMLKSIKNSINDLPKLQVDNVNKTVINECLDIIDINIKKINSAIKSKDKFVDNDKIRDDLNSIFKGKVGNEYTDSRLKEICKEAKFRYENRIPPGFKDEQKKTGNTFGDFIIWNQILDFAQEKNKSIIFITEDGKEDWWLDGEPHPYLIKEFSSKTKKEFYIYKFSDFLLEAKNYLEAKIKQKTINKVKENEKFFNSIYLIDTDKFPDKIWENPYLSKEMPNKYLNFILNSDLSDEDKIELLKKVKDWQFDYYKSNFYDWLEKISESQLKSGKDENGTEKSESKDNEDKDDESE